MIVGEGPPVCVSGKGLTYLTLSAREAKPPAFLPSISLLQPILSTCSLLEPTQGPRESEVRRRNPVLRDSKSIQESKHRTTKQPYGSYHKVCAQAGGYAWVESERSTVVPALSMVLLPTVQ